MQSQQLYHLQLEARALLQFQFEGGKRKRSFFSRKCTLCLACEYGCLLNYFQYKIAPLKEIEKVFFFFDVWRSPFVANFVIELDLALVV